MVYSITIPPFDGRVHLPSALRAEPTRDS
jgi:hypothetical protein